MARFVLPKKSRLYLKRDFRRVFNEGKAYHHKCLTIHVYVRDAYRTDRNGSSPNTASDLDSANNTENRRMGIVVSRKIGIAARRNKVKRRIREIFRLNQALIKQKSADIIFIPRKDSILLDYDRLQKIVFCLWSKAGLIDNKVSSSFIV